MNLWLPWWAILGLLLVSLFMWIVVHVRRQGDKFQAVMRSRVHVTVADFVAAGMSRMSAWSHVTTAVHLGHVSVAPKEHLSHERVNDLKVAINSGTRLSPADADDCVFTWRAGSLVVENPGKRRVRGPDGMA